MLKSTISQAVFTAPTSYPLYAVPDKNRPAANLERRNKIMLEYWSCIEAD